MAEACVAPSLPLSLSPLSRNAPPSRILPLLFQFPASLRFLPPPPLSTFRHRPNAFSPFLNFATLDAEFIDPLLAVRKERRSPAFPARSLPRAFQPPSMLLSPERLLRPVSSRLSSLWRSAEFLHPVPGQPRCHPSFSDPLSFFKDGFLGLPPLPTGHLSRMSPHDTSMMCSLFRMSPLRWFLRTFCFSLYFYSPFE